MNEHESSTPKADLDTLKALQADTSKLEHIEDLLDRFNVFEAIGFVGQEVKHSRFLAFLLDPQNSHGLGASFLRNFLQKVSESNNGEQFLDPENLRSRNLGETTVLTEVRTDNGRMDILLLNETGNWAMIVENKVWTTERHDQLDRYYQSVREDYPHRHVDGVYLTPHGDAPSHERYRPISYGTVCEILDRIPEDRDTDLSPDVRMAVKHYVDMVRSNIVKDADVSRLCREMYRKHRTTLHSIIDDSKASQEALHKFLKSLIKETPSFAYGFHDTDLFEDWIVFDHQDWSVPALKVGDRYKNSNRLIYFMFATDFPESFDICLELGMGDADARSKLFAMAHKNPTVFNVVPDELSEWTVLLRYPFLKPDLYEKLSDHEREKEIRQQWNGFLKHVLPQVEDALKGEAWIWKSKTNEGR